MRHMDKYEKLNEMVGEGGAEELDDTKLFDVVQFLGTPFTNHFIQLFILVHVPYSQAHQSAEHN